MKVFELFIYPWDPIQQPEPWTVRQIISHPKSTDKERVKYAFLFVKKKTIFAELHISMCIHEK